MMNGTKLRKGDTVTIIAGKDKKKSGKILKINHAVGRVVIDGLNIMKKSQKPKREGEKGTILEIEAPVHISNVMINCNKCGPVRIGYKFDEGKKVRICKKCGGTL
jgi:large subunit ribosomal protein L24